METAASQSHSRDWDHSCQRATPKSRMKSWISSLSRWGFSVCFVIFVVDVAAFVWLVTPGIHTYKSRTLPQFIPQLFFYFVLRQCHQIVLADLELFIFLPQFSESCHWDCRHLPPCLGPNLPFLFMWTQHVAPVLILKFSLGCLFSTECHGTKMLALNHFVSTPVG